MKSILTILFLFLFQAVNAQLSLSGGYIRRSDGKPIIFADHFWGKSQTYYLYDLAHFQVTKQKAPNREIVGKIDLFFGKKGDYSCAVTEYWGGQSNAYAGDRTYQSQINYSGMNLGFGINWLLKRAKNDDKKLRAITTLGFLTQLNLLLHSKEKNHFSTYRITKIAGPDQGVVYESSSDTVFKSFEKNDFILGLGLSLGERIIFNSTYFLELKMSLGITAGQALTPNQPKAVGLSDFKHHFQTNYPNNDIFGFTPVLQTGISFGYIFPYKKKKELSAVLGS